MSNPLFDRKPIRETIAWKISTKNIPRVTRDIQQQIEKRARDPSLYRSFPEMEELAQAEIELSRKIYDPANSQLFSAEAAKEAFKDIKIDDAL